MKEESSLFVGIDVSKDRLDVAVRPTGGAWQVSHDSRGISRLVERLGELAPQLIVLEATGGMEMALAGELAGSQLAIAVVNPRQVRDFARAAGKLAQPAGSDRSRNALHPGRFSRRDWPGHRPVALFSAARLTQREPRLFPRHYHFLTDCQHSAGRFFVGDVHCNLCFS